MFQNIKVDIIYYKTATDFEMEFNLSGCCRMRLLTDKAPDRKTLVNQLVRAVSRSRIIMIAGALFGDSGIIKTCAKAVSKPIVKIDNKQFGIADEDEIEIIKDSIPLVSSDGIFGGCIIEQGPQTLILLTENKNIRKDIMQNLIHSYVKEVCAGEMTEKPVEAVVAPIVEETPVEEEETGEVNEIIEDLTEEEIEEEINVSETVENNNEDEEIIEMNEFADKLSDQLVTHEEGDEELSPEYINKEIEDYDISNELITEIETVSRFKRKKDQEEYIDFGNEAEAYITDEENSKKAKLFSGINIPILILTLILLIIVIVLYYSIFIVPASQGVTAGEYLKETFDILFA